MNKPVENIFSAPRVEVEEEHGDMHIERWKPRIDKKRFSLRALFASVVAILAIVINVAFAAPTYHWQYYDSFPYPNNSQMVYVVYRAADSNGQFVTEIDGTTGDTWTSSTGLTNFSSLRDYNELDGKTIDDGYFYICKSYAIPSEIQVPAGGVSALTFADSGDGTGTVTVSDGTHTGTLPAVNVFSSGLPISNEQIQTELGDVSNDVITSYEAAPSSTDAILSKQAPTWFTHPDLAFKYFLFETAYNFSSYLLDLSSVALSSIDPIALFSADLQGVGWSSLYNRAVQISKTIVLPYGTAILVVYFILHIARIQEERITFSFETVMRTFLLYALAWTLVAHGVQLFSGIYWLGKNLVAGVDVALTAFNAPVNAPVGEAIAESGISLSTLISNVKTQLMNAMQQVTYEDWGLGFLYLLLTIITCVVSFTVALKIFALSLLRMAEIYLRIAFAGFPLAFAIDDRRRHAAASWAWRFAVLCAEGAVVVVALALAQEFSAVLTPLLSGLGAGQNAGEGFAALITTFVSAAPAMIAIYSVGQIVDRAHHVAADLFSTPPIL